MVLFESLGRADMLTEQFLEVPIILYIIVTHLYHPPKNTLSFQRITPHPPSEWHYIRVMARSDGVFSDPSRRGIDRQRVVNLA